MPVEEAVADGQLLGDVLQVHVALAVGEDAFAPLRVRVYVVVAEDAGA